jgi:hypothetical protein
MTTGAATDDQVRDRLESPSQARLPALQTSRSRVAEFALILLIFFIAGGDLPPNVNEPHYLGRLKHYWNPQWCAGDLFLESTDTQVVFIWLFGWVTRWLSLTATAWIGRLLAWTLLAWSWQRLSWRIMPRTFVAPLSAALFVALNNYGHMAGEWVVGGVEAKCFAYGFVLLALEAMIDSRWNAVGLLLGAAIAFHPIVGGWSALVCGGIWLIEVRKKGVRTILSFRATAGRTANAQNGRFPILGTIGGGLLALIGLVPVLSLTWHEPVDVVSEANRIYVFDRLPHHLALLTLPGTEPALRLTRHAVLLLGVWLGYRAAKRTVVPIEPIRRVTYFALGAAFIALTGFIIELGLWDEPLLAARLLRYYWFRLTDFAAPMAFSLTAIAVVIAGLENKRRWATVCLIAALLVEGCYQVEVTVPRWMNPIPPADARMTDYAAWVDVCDWVAANTPPDALFLTPRLNQTFKWRAGRPEVANRKDIPQDAHTMVEWSRRIKDIYTTQVAGIEQPLDSLGILGTERVRELAQKYSAKFVLMDRGQLLSLPIVYRNQEYVVYRIEDRGASHSR